MDKTFVEWLSDEFRKPIYNPSMNAVNPNETRGGGKLFEDEAMQKHLLALANRFQNIYTKIYAFNNNWAGGDWVKFDIVQQVIKDILMGYESLAEVYRDVAMWGKNPLYWADNQPYLKLDTENQPIYLSEINAALAIADAHPQYSPIPDVKPAEIKESLKGHIKGILSGKEFYREKADVWKRGNEKIDLKNLISDVTQRLIQKALGDEYWKDIVSTQGGWSLEHVAEKLSSMIENPTTLKSVAYQVDGALIERGVLRQSKDIKGTYEINPEYIEGVESLIGTKGGKGSGHYGHAGRPGKVGGSAPAGSGGGKIGDSGGSGYPDNENIRQFIRDEENRLMERKTPQMSVPRAGVTRDMMVEFNRIRQAFASATRESYRGERKNIADYINEHIQNGFTEFKKVKQGWELWKGEEKIHVRDTIGMGYIDVLNYFKKNHKELSKPKISDFVANLPEPSASNLTRNPIGLKSMKGGSANQKNTEKGGKGSGNFGHAGRPGKVGGSSPNKSGGKIDNRDAAGHVNSRLLDMIDKNHGFSLAAGKGDFAKTGMVLSPYEKQGKVFDGAKIELGDIKTFARRNAKLLANPNHFLGAWLNLEDKPPKVYLDVSIIVKTRRQAAKLCVENNQLAFYDIEKGVTVYVDKYGKMTESVKEYEVITSMETKEKGKLQLFAIDANASDDEIQKDVDRIHEAVARAQKEGQADADKERDDLLGDLSEGKK